MREHYTGRKKSFWFGGWRGNIRSIWFNAWVGLGASCVLRAIAGILKSASCDSNTRNHFGKIIHVDCSLWKSRRAMQKIIAQELGLHDLMPLFDKADEDDDFRGVDDSSRAELTSIGTAIWQSLRNERFLVIFHCGTDEIMNLQEFGIPALTFSDGKLLWTSPGRFHPLSDPSLDLKSVIIFCSGISSAPRFLSALHEEAVELIRYTGTDSINPDLIVKCYKYLVSLSNQGRRYENTPLDYGWITHACNYWVCDGILQGDTAWEIGDALHPLLLAPLSYDNDAIERVAEYLGMNIKGGEWVSSDSYEHGPPQRESTSYFLTNHHRKELQIDSFLQAKNLRVLKLYNCSFDFSSPPFLCCQNLRFLWLDTCNDNTKEHGVVPRCFPNLWVFDLRFTEYVYFQQVAEMMRDLRELNAKGVSWKIISQAWKKLQNLHKLRVTNAESSEVITTDSCSPIDMMNLELLDLSTNTQMKSLPDLSLAQRLKMIVLDGCSSLEHVMLERAPMLEIFSFDGYGQAKEWTSSLHLPQQELRPKSRVAEDEAKVSKISLEGCARLHSIFLRALLNLQELNLSGTAIKRLDIGAMDVRGLKNLFLRGCEKLRSLIWDGERPALEVLHVDTLGEASSVMCCEEHEKFEYAEVIVLDGRSIWSVMRGVYKKGGHVHLHISSTVSTQVHVAKKIQDTSPNIGDYVATGPFLPPYMDIHFAEDVAHSGLLSKIHLEIGGGSYNVERMGDDEYFCRFLDWYLKSLHVHDNSSITAIPSSPDVYWEKLEWCHADKCPKLQTVFACKQKRPLQSYFTSLVAFSGIDLLMAHCIWEKGFTFYGIRYTDDDSFSRLQHIYLNNCPRLVYVLPVSFDLPGLETIQIEHCSSLKCIFPLDDKCPEEAAARVEFSNLKHIKLRHLHNMEQICGARVLYAPQLETINVRDCWGLRRLPAISSQRSHRPTVECEKDWWDKLQWDRLHAGHHPSRFETRHSSRYYKKTMLKVSVLR